IVKIRRVAVVAHLRTVLKAELGHVGASDWPDAAPALADGFGEFRGSPAQSADRAHACDGDAAHRQGWAARLGLAVAACSFSKTSHIWRTLRTLRTSSSGMLISNSFSRANRISTASMESIPNC